MMGDYFRLPAREIIQVPRRTLRNMRIGLVVHVVLATIAELDRAPTVAAALPAARGAPKEQPESGPRAELALFHTIHGIVVGVEVCVVSQCDSASAFVALALLGGGLGATIALGTTGQ